MAAWFSTLTLIVGAPRMPSHNHGGVKPRTQVRVDVEGLGLGLGAEVEGAPSGVLRYLVTASFSSQSRAQLSTASARPIGVRLTVGVGVTPAVIEIRRLRGARVRVGDGVRLAEPE